MDLGTDPVTGQKLTPEDVSPAFLQILKNVKSDNDKRLAAIEDKFKNQEIQTNRDVIDSAFESLPAEYQPLVGKGSITDLPDGSSEIDIRTAIYASANIDPTRDSPRQKATKIAAAAKKLYGKVVAAPAPAPTPDPYEASKGGAKRITPEQFNNAAVAKPTSREPAPREESGDDAAKKAAREWMKQNGYEDEATAIASTLNGVPA